MIKIDLTGKPKPIRACYDQIFYTVSVDVTTPTNHLAETVVIDPVFINVNLGLLYYQIWFGARLGFSQVEVASSLPWKPPIPRIAYQEISKTITIHIPHARH
jgi:hypothetical protein